MIQVVQASGGGWRFQVKYVRGGGQQDVADGDEGMLVVETGGRGTTGGGTNGTTGVPWVR